MGGLLVIFAYLLAINPNSKLLKFTNFQFILILRFITIGLFFKPDFIIIHPFRLDNNLSIMDLIYVNYLIALTVIILGLLITLIAVVKITSRQSGSLRPFNYD